MIAPAPTPTRGGSADHGCRSHDAGFLTGERTSEGFYKVQAGIEQAISRGLAYAPYADMVWCETAKPDLDEARKFAGGHRAQYPDKILASCCSPSFSWKKNLDDATIARFQQELSDMGSSTSSSPWRYPQHVVPCTSWPTSTPDGEE